MNLATAKSLTEIPLQQFLKKEQELRGEADCIDQTMIVCTKLIFSVLMQIAAAIEESNVG